MKQPAQSTDDKFFFYKSTDTSHEHPYAIWRIPVGRTPELAEGSLDDKDFAYVTVEYSGDEERITISNEKTDDCLIKAYTQLDAIDKMRLYHKTAFLKPIDCEWYEMSEPS